MIISVQPIYGNGWTDGQTDVTEPELFEVDAVRREDGTISGRITVSDDKILSGAIFEATPRHVAEDMLYNCSIRYQDGRRITGYCHIRFSI